MEEENIEQLLEQVSRELVGGTYAFARNKLREISMNFASKLPHKDYVLLKKQFNNFLRILAIEPVTKLYKYDFLEYVHSLVLPKIEKEKRDVSVLIGDIDNLHEVNKNGGYKTGTNLINIIGGKIGGIVNLNTRKNYRINEKGFIAKDIAARMHTAGDEFVVVLYGTDFEGAEIVANRMIEQINTNYEVKKNGSGITVGGAYRNGSANLPYLIGKADEELKKGKEICRGKYYFSKSSPTAEIPVVA